MKANITCAVIHGDRTQSQRERALRSFSAGEMCIRDRRIIEVFWEEDGPSGDTSFNVQIFVEALDRLNLLMDVASVLSEHGANVLSVNTNTHRDGMVEMRFLFQVSDTAVIERILSKLRAVDGVFDAHRMMPGAASSK